MTYICTVGTFQLFVSESNRLIPTIKEHLREKHRKANTEDDCIIGWSISGSPKLALVPKSWFHLQE